MIKEFRGWKVGSIIQCISDFSVHGPVGHILEVASFRMKNEEKGIAYNWAWCHAVRGVRYGENEYDRLRTQHPYGNFGIKEREFKIYKIINMDWDE